MKKIFTMLLLIVVVLSTSCASPTSPTDVPPVDGEYYDWAYVQAHANYEITFYGSGNPRDYLTPGVSYYGGKVTTVDGYFRFFPLKVGPSYNYNKSNIVIGGNWEVIPLD